MGLQREVNLANIFEDSPVLTMAILFSSVAFWPSSLALPRSRCSPGH